MTSPPANRARGRWPSLLLSAAVALPGAAARAEGTTAPTAAPTTAQARFARRAALFIEQFTRLIEWPERALPKGSPFVLCTSGASETAEELTKLAAIRKFRQRPTEVRRLAADADPDGCHVLYLAASAASRVQQLLTAVADKPVLTVSDTAGFAARGVHFNFFEETRLVPEPGTYLGFELSVPAVRRSVLTFDPRLLSSGRRVDAAPAPDPSRSRARGH